MIAQDRGGDRLAAQLLEAPVAKFQISTLPDLGALARGLRAKETSTIASFPKHGKTALAEQLVLDLSIEHPVLFLALEMGEAATWLRLGAKLARCSVDTIEKTGLDLVTQQMLNQRKLLVRAPQTGRKWSIRQIANGIEKSGAPIVVIDHLRWIDGWLEGGMAPTKIAEQIVTVAHTLGVHIVQCAQLKIEDLGKKPALWRLQDSAAIQQLTSLEILINRPYHGMGEDRDRIAELVVRSNRWGPTGRVHSRWVGETQTFWHLTRDEFENQFDCSCKPRAKKVAS